MAAAAAAVGAAASLNFRLQRASLGSCQVLKRKAYKSTGPARPPEGAQTRARRPEEEVANGLHTAAATGCRFSERLPSV